LALVSDGKDGSGLAPYFSTPDGLNAMFVSSAATEEWSGLDLDALDSFYKSLSEKQLGVAIGFLEKACGGLVPLFGSRFFLSRRGLRLLDVVLQFPMAEEPSLHRKVITPVLEAVAALDDNTKERLARFCCSLSTFLF
jgi:hypothetical protein